MAWSLIIVKHNKAVRIEGVVKEGLLELSADIILHKLSFLILTRFILSLKKVFVSKRRKIGQRKLSVSKRFKKLSKSQFFKKVIAN